VLPTGAGKKTGGLVADFTGGAEQNTVRSALATKTRTAIDRHENNYRKIFLNVVVSS